MGGHARPLTILSMGLVTKLEESGATKYRLVVDYSMPRGSPDNPRSVNEWVKKHTEKTQLGTIAFAAAAVKARLVDTPSGGAGVNNFCTHWHDGSTSVAFKCDGQDMFMQYPISAESRLHSAIQWDGQVYVFERCTFGMTSTPHLAQSAMVYAVRAWFRRLKACGLHTGTPPAGDHTHYVNRPSKAHQHSLTQTCVVLDDVCAIATSKQAADFAFLHLLALFEQLGLAISPKKHKVCPPVCDKITFVGYLLDFQRMEIRLEQERCEKLCRRLDHISVQRKMTVKQAQSLAGVMTFFNTVLRARQYTRFIFNLISQHRHKQFIVLEDHHIRHIQRWHWVIKHLNKACVLRGVLVPKVQWDAWSDASFDAMAFCFCGYVFLRRFPPQWRQRFGNHGKGDRIWINTAEMTAVLAFARVTFPWIAGKRILLWCDNKACVSWINNAAAKAKAVDPLVRELFCLCMTYSVELNCMYIPSKLNCTADSASRLFTATGEERQKLGKVIEDYRKKNPPSWQEAGLRWSPPTRPELIPLGTPVIFSDIERTFMPPSPWPKTWVHDGKVQAAKADWKSTNKKRSFHDNSAPSRCKHLKVDAAAPRIVDMGVTRSKTGEVASRPGITIGASSKEIKKEQVSAVHSHATRADIPFVLQHNGKVHAVVDPKQHQRRLVVGAGVRGRSSEVVPRGRGRAGSTPTPSLCEATPSLPQEDPSGQAASHSSNSASTAPNDH